MKGSGGNIECEILAGVSQKTCIIRQAITGARARPCYPEATAPRGGGDRESRRSGRKGRKEATKMEGRGRRYLAVAEARVDDGDAALFGAEGRVEVLGALLALHKHDHRRKQGLSTRTVSPTTEA